MVAGLVERERVRDLFGRHVGTNVARRAIEEGASMSGGVQEVAVLFIDLAGSTALAASHPPQQVAEVLNEFFHIVVDAVDAREGMINKFQGDAALAVFGAPLRPRAQPRRRWRRRAPSASSCAGCPTSTSGSASRLARCSQETSAPRTATSTP